MCVCLFSVPAVMDLGGNIAVGHVEVVKHSVMLRRLCLHPRESEGHGSPIQGRLFAPLNVLSDWC